MRHHILRLAGLGVAVVLAICLGAVVVAMTGGPQAPLTQWAVPRPNGHAAQQGAAHATASNGAPSAAEPVSTTRAIPAASAGPSVTPSTSLPATNSAGRTPPGQVKSPNPHKPSIAA